jgi:hypothetical protein
MKLMTNKSFSKGSKKKNYKSKELGLNWKKKIYDKLELND